MYAVVSLSPFSAGAGSWRVDCGATSAAATPAPVPNSAGIWIGSTTCSGTPDTQYNSFPSGECFSAGGASYSLNCYGSAASSNWGLTVYQGTGCSGQSASLSGSGSTCASVSTISVSMNCTGTTNPSKSCFSSEDTVQRADGAVIKYSDMAVGDRVLSVGADGKAFFDKVFRITHHDATSTAEFVRLTTASGHVLELSEGHMTHVGTCQPSPSLQLGVCPFKFKLSASA